MPLKTSILAYFPMFEGMVNQDIMRGATWRSYEGDISPISTNRAPKIIPSTMRTGTILFVKTQFSVLL